MNESLKNSGNDTTVVALLHDGFVAARATLSVAESITAGRLQSLLTGRSGASAFFLGGITAYHLDQKVRHLGVDRSYAEACDCVSEQTACEMAIGARRLFGSDWSVVTTGYAESDVGKGILRPLAWIAVADRQGEVRAERVEADGDRCAVQNAIAYAALGFLWKCWVTSDVGRPE